MEYTNAELTEFLDMEIRNTLDCIDSLKKTDAGGGLTKTYSSDIDKFQKLKEILKSSQRIDRFEDLFVKQRELMTVIEGRMHQECTVTNDIVAMVSEIGELLNEHGEFKFWKRNHHAQRSQILEEYVDIFFFWMQAGIRLGFSTSEIYTQYLHKHDVNIERQKNNY